jgi:GT2 family glycosyltransferase
MEMSYGALVQEAEQARAEWLRAQLLTASSQLTGLRSEIEELRLERDGLARRLGDIDGSRAFRLAAAARGLRAAITRRRPHGSREPARAPTDEHRSRGLPSVSVIMPIFNKGATLMESIASVKAQTLPTWELIIWDDGSTDPETGALLDALPADPGIVVMRSSNQGVVAARNAAIRHSRGAFICCLDPDDTIDPTYLEKALLYLESHPDVALVYPFQQNFQESTDRFQLADLHPKIISQQNCVPVCAVIRREAWEDAGGFNPAMSGGCEDWELWANVAELGYVGRVIPEYLFSYRFSLTTGRNVVSRTRIDEIRKRIMRLHPLLGDSALPRKVGNWIADGAQRLRSQPWTMPSSERRPVVFFVPSLAVVDEAEPLLRVLAGGLVAEGRTVVFIATSPTAPGSSEAATQLQAITPYVYVLANYLGDDLWLAFVRSVLWRLHLPVIVNVGSTWLYDNLSNVRRETRGPARVVDVLLDHRSHLPASMASGELIDERTVANSMLEQLLVDHFHVPGQVRTVAIDADTLVMRYSEILG